MSSPGGLLATSFLWLCFDRRTPSLIRLQYLLNEPIPKLMIMASADPAVRQFLSLEKKNYVG
eukprot:scaffold96070_cov19-Tisochrysis_lutea.AAC.1